MAVQAQYPSNVLLLNAPNKTAQDGLDSSNLFQPQTGPFLDPSHSLSHMFFSNGGSVQRKRGREVSTTTIPIQTQASQLIDLSQAQLQFHHPNAVSTGLRLSSGDQQQQLISQTQHFQQHQKQQNQHEVNLVTYQSPLTSLLSEDLAAQIKQYREELDQYLHAQGEQLRRAFAEKRQRHCLALLRAVEEPMLKILREKEAEMEKAARRQAELEAKAAKLMMEAQVWQARARVQEAAAASLQAQLQQAIISGTAAATAAATHDGSTGEEGLKNAGGVEGPPEDAESAYIDPNRVAEVAGPPCKSCRRSLASVVLLPCRHLCLCTECDQVAQVCPLCLSARNSSVEVFLSSSSFCFVLFSNSPSSRETPER